ncbi:MAG: alpha/beta hydrolase [Bacteroidota bacterium]
MMKSRILFVLPLVAGISLSATLLIFIAMAAVASGQQRDDRMQIPDIPTEKVEMLVDLGGRKLDCCIYGEGSPTILLLSGGRAPQVYWNPVVPDLAEKTTVLTYDRSGCGKSPLGDLPTHGVQAAKDLDSLLKALNLPKPYIVVGHSYGGKVARLFTSMYPDDVGGLILEDTQHEDVLQEERKILKGEDLRTFEEMVAMMKGRDPPVTEIDYISTTAEQVRESGPLPEIPFVVISSGKRLKSAPREFSEEGQEALAKLNMELQERLVNLIPGGRQIIVEDVGHNIHVEKPDALIIPVLEMVEKLRRSGQTPQSR